MKEKNKKILAIISFIMFVISGFMLLIVDWRIALGVYLFGWADNISKQLNDHEN